MSVCYAVQEVRNTVDGEVCVTIAVRCGVGLLSSGCRTAFFVGTLGDPAASSHAHSEPVWPSGKACRQRSPQFESASALLSLQKVVVCGHSLVTLSLTIMKH